jgi:hypothetical protein
MPNARRATIRRTRWSRRSRRISARSSAPNADEPQGRGSGQALRMIVVRWCVNVELAPALVLKSYLGAEPNAERQHPAACGPMLAPATIRLSAASSSGVVVERSASYRFPERKDNTKETPEMVFSNWPRSHVDGIVVSCSARLRRTRKAPVPSYEVPSCRAWSNRPAKERCALKY